MAESLHQNIFRQVGTLGGNQEITPTQELSHSDVIHTLCKWNEAAEGPSANNDFMAEALIDPLNPEAVALAWYVTDAAHARLHLDEETTPELDALTEHDTNTINTLVQTAQAEFRPPTLEFPFLQEKVAAGNPITPTDILKIHGQSQVARQVTSLTALSRMLTAARNVSTVQHNVPLYDEAGTQGAFMTPEQVENSLRRADITNSVDTNLIRNVSVALRSLIGNNEVDITDPNAVRSYLNSILTDSAGIPPDAGLNELIKNAHPRQTVRDRGLLSWERLTADDLLPDEVFTLLETGMGK